MCRKSRRVKAVSRGEENRELACMRVRVEGERTESTNFEKKPISGNRKVRESGGGFWETSTETELVRRGRGQKEKKGGRGGTGELQFPCI